MNRFQTSFLEKLARFCKEEGYIIIDGYVESLEDWVDPGKDFSYVASEDSKGIRLVDVLEK